MAGNISIINATPFAWQRTIQNAHQMTTWEFPDTVEPGELVTVATEWGTTGLRSDDVANAGYSFSTPSGEDVGFQFQAAFGNSPQLSVLLDNSSTFGNPPGTTIDLSFTDETITPFILSGQTKAALESTNPPIDWMNQNLPSIGCLPLNRICMPASHNAGMSVLNGRAGPATPENTLCHYTDILGQLRAGYRFFDIRPVIAGGQMMTGHYSNTLSDAGFLDDLLDVWVGGNGQSIASIIDQINQFLSNNRELVIINLSHTLDTDNGYKTFTQDEQNRLFKQLLNLKNRFILPKGASLANLSLNDYLKDGPAVVIILDNAQAGEHMSASSFPNQGFYTNADLPIYNQYSNTDDAGKMSKDQLSKMRAQRTGPNSKSFLLSWTLTTVIDIRMWAGFAHERLFKDLWPSVSKESYPNYIMVDGVGSKVLEPGNVVALCLGVVGGFNDVCS
jgi:hypothetical protein